MPDLEKMITLEVTDHCNLKCKMCTQANTNEPHGTPKGFMSLETWKSFINGLKYFEGITTLTPFWVGESLLNPEFLSMLDYAFHKNEVNQLFDTVTINTNGILLDEKGSRKILELSALKNQNESTMRRIHFSLDANSPLTFKIIKGKDYFNVVRNNILKFLKLRGKSKFPKITIALIVMKENKNEVKDFLEYWTHVLKKYNEEIEITWDWPKKMLDTIYIRRLDDWENQAKAEMLHKETIKKLGLINEGGKRIIRTNSVLGFEEDNVRKPCPGLWRTPIIHRNGDVSVCCFDILMKNVIGNVNKTPLGELWDSDLINKWRLAHIKGEFDKAAPLCKTCGNLFGPELTDEHVRSWLKETGRQEMIEGYNQRIK